jgi:hypothetical protein
MRYETKDMVYRRKAPTRCPLCGHTIRKGDDCTREQRFDEFHERPTRFWHPKCYEAMTGNDGRMGPYGRNV